MQAGLTGRLTRILLVDRLRELDVLRRRGRWLCRSFSLVAVTSASSAGIDTPEIGSHAKCLKERKLALIVKGRLKELLAEKGLRIVLSGAVDRRRRTGRQHLSNERGRDREEAAEGKLRQDVEPEAAERMVFMTC